MSNSPLNPPSHPLTALGVAPGSHGPVGVMLLGHNDQGDEFSVGAYGDDIFSASDTARAFLEHQLWEFHFLADDYRIYRWPERICAETTNNYTEAVESTDG